MSDSLSIRVVLIGDSQVGKSSLIHRFVRKSFEKQKNTVGAVFHTYEEEINGKKVIMQIWDTAGQEKYRSLGPIYYRNASAGIAVFDISAKDPLQNLQRWIDDFRRQTDNPSIFVVGNKTDLRTPESIPDSKVIEFANRNGAQAFFTSAKSGDNVSELFHTVFNHLVQDGKFAAQQEQQTQVTVQAERKSGCC